MIGWKDEKTMASKGDHVNWAGLFIDLAVKNFLTSITNNHNFVKGMTELVVFSQLLVINNYLITHCMLCSPMSQAKPNVISNLKKEIKTTTSHPLSHIIYKLFKRSR